MAIFHSYVSLPEVKNNKNKNNNPSWYKNQHIRPPHIVMAVSAPRKIAHPTTWFEEIIFTMFGMKPNNKHFLGAVLDAMALLW